MIRLTQEEITMVKQIWYKLFWFETSLFQESQYMF